MPDLYARDIRDCVERARRAVKRNAQVTRARLRAVRGVRHASDETEQKCSDTYHLGSTRMRTNSQRIAPTMANTEPLASVGYQPKRSSISPTAGARNPARFPPAFSTPVADAVFGP